MAVKYAAAVAAGQRVVKKAQEENAAGQRVVKKAQEENAAGQRVVKKAQEENAAGLRAVKKAQEENVDLEDAIEEALQNNKKTTTKQKTTEQAAASIETDILETMRQEQRARLAELNKEQSVAASAASKSSPELAAALDRLLAEYNSLPGYTQKTREELLQQAEDEYAGQYDQLRIAAQQQQERSDLAIQQQREGLQDTYDRQREESDRAYQRAYSQADKQLLSRGMQRSSYGGQTLANLAKEGVEANQRLWEQQAAAEGNLDAQRAQLAQQLAEQLRQYDVSKASDVLSRVRQLEEQDYQRGMENQNMRTQLASQLYSLLRQSERDQISDEQWEKQYGLTKQQLETELEAALYQREYQAQRDQVSDEQWAKEYALKAAQSLASTGSSYSGGYSSSYSGKSSSSGYTPYEKYQKELFEKERQANFGSAKTNTQNTNGGVSNGTPVLSYDDLLKDIINPGSQGTYDPLKDYLKKYKNDGAGSLG